MVGGQPPRRLAAVEIGKPKVHQHQVRPMLEREGKALGGRCRGERAHPGRLEHIASEFRVLFVVVDDQHELGHCVILGSW